MFSESELKFFHQHAPRETLAVAALTEQVEGTCERLRTADEFDAEPLQARLAVLETELEQALANLRSALGDAGFAPEQEPVPELQAAAAQADPRMTAREHARHHVTALCDQFRAARSQAERDHVSEEILQAEVAIAGFHQAPARAARRPAELALVFG